MIDEKCVALIKAQTLRYARTTPFHPSERFPEYSFNDLSKETNDVYAAVRELLITLGLDTSHFNTKEWNPLGEFISPGDNVLIKPNFVMDRHVGGGDYHCVVTHGSVIRPVLDYILIALKGRGQVTIADAPMINNDFNRIMQLSGVNEIVKYFRQNGIDVKLYDLRVEDIEMRDGLIIRRFNLPGDPLGYVPINLGQESAFADISNLYRKYRGSDYDSCETSQHHNDRVNEYLLSKTVLASNVFINMPKLKTHKKIGVTLNLKNLIGINGDKNWIPHYRVGNPKRGGDEFDTTSILRHMESLLKDKFKEKVFEIAQGESKGGLYIARKLRKAQKAVVDYTNITKIRAGGWYGNDTIWRAVLDLNKILLYADSDGNMRANPQRRFFSIIDGIIGGEGDGPVLATSRPCGVLVGGFNPLAVDICATRLMGFDHQRFTQFRKGLVLKKFPLMSYNEDQINCLSNVPEWCDILNKRENLLNFKVASGWEGKIELDGE
jgi:uncharacterized protein (DUF362 family)